MECRLFEVPAWAGGNTTNTCTVDGFLTLLLCTKWKDPFFPSRLIGDDPFTRACREFVSNEKKSIEDRKGKFIKTLYSSNAAGDFNLWGDEANMILAKAKTPSEITLTVRCKDCYLKKTETRNTYIVRRQEGESLREALLDTIAGPSRDYCEEGTCTETKQVDVSLGDETWMIPIDLSQTNIAAIHIDKIPPRICLGDAAFTLAGVTVYIGSKGTKKGEIGKKKAGHYAAIMWNDNRWLYYDGMDRTPMRKFRKLARVELHARNNTPTKCKIAYYFRETLPPNRELNPTIERLPFIIVPVPAPATDSDEKSMDTS